MVVWTAESRDDEDRPVRDPGAVSYTAAIESAARRDTHPDPSEFARRMRREAERRGFTLARRRVILGAGASWIWRIASEDYPGAIQIVDLWPAKEQLWELAKVLCAHDKALVEPWADARCADLEQGRIDGLLATLRAHADTCEQAGKCANYIEKNRSRMRYPEYRAQGLCVGSGVVESGCRTVVGRLKRSGMYWTVSGANAILRLRYIVRRAKALAPSGCKSRPANCRSSRKQSERLMEATTWTEALCCKRVAIGRLSEQAGRNQMNAEQASKKSMRRPTRRCNGEGCQRPGSERRAHRSAPPGYWRQHACKRGTEATREAPSVVRTRQTGIPQGTGRAGQGGGEVRTTGEAG